MTGGVESNRMNPAKLQAGGSGVYRPTPAIVPVDAAWHVGPSTDGHARPDIPLGVDGHRGNLVAAQTVRRGISAPRFFRGGHNLRPKGSLRPRRDAGCRP